MGIICSVFSKSTSTTSFHYDPQTFDSLLSTTKTPVQSTCTTSFSTPEDSTTIMSPPLDSSTNENPSIDHESHEARTCGMKRKRLIEDEAHRSRSKTARILSPIRFSSPTYEGYESEKDMDGKSKRKRDGDEEHGSLSKAPRRRSPVRRSDTAGSTEAYTSTSAQKRKREEDDEHGSLAKVGRHYSPIPSSSPVGSTASSATMPTSDQGLKRKRSVEDEEQGAFSKSARTYSTGDSSGSEDMDIDSSEEEVSLPPLKERKRKRAMDDDEHGALSKAARTYSPVNSSDIEDLDELHASPLRPLERKRKRSGHDDEHGALSKAARTYSPVNSSDIEDLYEPASSPRPLERKRKRSGDDNEHGALSKAARTYSPVNSGESDFSDDNSSIKKLKRKHSEDLDHTNDSISRSKRQRRSPAPSRSPPPTKSKRNLPWLDPDYPYYTKRPRIEILTNPNNHPEPPHLYDGLRYSQTSPSPTLKWTRFGILLGELTHLKVPKTAPGLGNTNRHKNSRHQQPLFPLPPKPPVVSKKNQLKAREQHKIDKAKAKKEARKKVVRIPKVEYKKEEKERYWVYAKFNRKMRFSLRIVPELKTKTVEFRSTNPGTHLKEKGVGLPPVIKTETEKVHFGKQIRLPLEQFDLYLTVGRMVWDEEWKAVFGKGERDMKQSGAVVNDKGEKDKEQSGAAATAEGDEEEVTEDVGEGVREMGGLMAVMRKVMACPPSDVNIDRRIRCFHATGIWNI